MKQQPKKILFAGGGSLGPVTPLFAIFDNLQSSDKGYQFHWVGTKKGPERQLVAKRNIAFDALVTAKLHRFFSLKNVLMPFYFVTALVQSYKVLKRFKPDIIVSAGGFVSVPIIWIGWMLRIPSHIHQLDVQAKANQVMVISGASTVPTLSSAVIDYFLPQFSKLKSIQCARRTKNLYGLSGFSMFSQYRL